MTQTNEAPEPREDAERHPLESEDALREPRDIDENEESEQAPKQPVLTPFPSED